MDFRTLDIIFQVIVFLMAIAVHESAHAWMANRCGDPTARMLGRITLNPLKHIDPIGTVLLPAIGLLTGAGIFGWAKPCPVNPNNFKNEVKDDIYTTVAGPVSNLILVMIAITVMAMTTLLFKDDAREIIRNLTENALTDTPSTVMPVLWFCHTMVMMNLLLFVFNLLPVPPLDGSHVIRHALPDSIRSIYDSVGMVGFLILFSIGGKFMGIIMQPVWQIANGLLLKL